MKLFQRRSSVIEIAPSEASTRVTAGDAILVDVREGFEWQLGHASPARHIPLGNLASSAGNLPRDKEILVICASGNRSKKGASILQDAGFTALSVAGGTAAWAKQGLEINR